MYAMMSSVSSGVRIRFGIVAWDVCRNARRLSSETEGSSTTSKKVGAPTPGSSSSSSDTM
jgi:hypothetical protein